MMATIKLRRERCKGCGLGEGDPGSGVDCLPVPGRELALEAGNERLADMVIMGSLVEKSSVVGMKVLQKALYPGLDVRYHFVIPANQGAMDKGAEFVRNGARR